jgi:hypothetical protein
MKTINLTELNSRVQAYQNCLINGNVEWMDKHYEHIIGMLENLPHGSGIDGKFILQTEECEKQKLVFFLEYHHMDEHGGYDGWTEHNLIITPEFGDFKMKITGRNKNGIKEYLQDLLREHFTI